MQNFFLVRLNTNRPDLVQLYLKELNPCDPQKGLAPLSWEMVLTHYTIVSILVIYILCILVSFIDILVSILVLYILCALVPLLYIIVSILVPKETSWILSPPRGTAGTDILQQISVTQIAKM